MTVYPVLYGCHTDPLPYVGLQCDLTRAVPLGPFLSRVFEW